MNITITALLSASMPRNGMSLSPGHIACKTCGIVSPTTTPNATIPPNANSHCARDMATSPLFPKQCSTVPWKLLAPLSLLLTTMRQMVQSTTAVSPTSSPTPARSPAWRNAYGWPMMPAPMMLLAMFMKADRRPDLGRRRSPSAHECTSPPCSPAIQGPLASATDGASIPVSSGVRCCPPRAPSSSWKSRSSRLSRCSSSYEADDDRRPRLSSKLSA